MTGAIDLNRRLTPLEVATIMDWTTAHARRWMKQNGATHRGRRLTITLGKLVELCPDVAHDELARMTASLKFAGDVEAMLKRVDAAERRIRVLEAKLREVRHQRRLSQQRKRRNVQRKAVTEETAEMKPVTG